MSWDSQSHIWTLVRPGCQGCVCAMCFRAAGRSRAWFSAGRSCCHVTHLQHIRIISACSYALVSSLHTARLFFSKWYMVSSVILVFSSVSSDLTFSASPVHGQLYDQLLSQTHPSFQHICHSALAGLQHRFKFLPPPPAEPPAWGILTSLTCLLLIVFNKFTLKSAPCLVSTFRSVTVPSSQHHSYTVSQLVQ